MRLRHKIKYSKNAILVTKDASISNVSVSKTGDSDSGDSTSFYGTNSAILAKDGATLTLKNIKVTTDAKGANGLFSYGGSAITNNSLSDGTTVNISDSTITTSKDNSGGIMTTGGGIMNATNLKITMAGTSSAAILSDRGGGTVTIDKGTYKTTGKGSPTIYSTAGITMKTNSSYKGTINSDKSAKNIKLTLDKSSKIILTGDSYASNLNDEDSTYSNIDFNGYKLYVNGKAIN